MNFMKHLKNLSSTSKYVEISIWALFNAMEELQIDQKFGVFLRVLRKRSEVFFQLETNQKHIYNVIIRPKLNVVSKHEGSKFYPIPNLHICHLHMAGVIKDLNIEISDETFKFKSL